MDTKQTTLQAIFEREAAKLDVIVLKGEYDTDGHMGGGEVDRKSVV